MLLAILTLFLLLQCRLELQHVQRWLRSVLELLLSVGIRSVERIIEGEIEVAGYLLLVWFSLLWLLFLEQFLVNTGNTLVGELEDVFHRCWRCGEGILLLGVQRWLNFGHLLVLAMNLDGWQRQSGLERRQSLAISHRCHGLAPLLCLDATGQSLVEGVVPLESIHRFLSYLQRYAGLGVAGCVVWVVGGGCYGLEEALCLRFRKLLGLRIRIARQWRARLALGA